MSPRTGWTRSKVGRPRGSGLAGRSRFVVLPALLVPLACGGPPPPPPTPLPTLPPGRAVVVQDPEATTVAVAVVTPGSAWELPGTRGLTLLAARTLLEQVRPALDTLGARADIACGPAAFTFTLVATRDAWQPALDTFLDGLFRPAPSPAALERARSQVRASLALDQASPAWQARLAVRRSLHDDTLSSGWTGPVCGVPETLGLFDLADIRAGAHRFAPRMAHVAVITPTEPAPVRGRLARRFPADGPPPLPAPRTTAPGRQYVERNTVTAWLSVAFPFRDDADVESIRLLGAVLEDAIGPGVDRPETFTASHEVARHGAGGALIVHAVAAPEAVEGIAARIEELAVRTARVGAPEPAYERVARRYRGQRLLELAAPEDRVAAMALDLALGREPRPWPDVEWTPSRLQDAARSLGSPARSVVGPRPAGGSREP